MVDEVYTWLNGDQGFRSGRLLYQKYGKDPDLLRALVAKPESPALKNSLYFAIKGLVVAPAAQEQAEQSFVAPVPAAVPGSPNEEVPAIVIAAKRDADRLYKELMNARALVFSDCSTEMVHGENFGLNVLARVPQVKEVMRLQALVSKAYAAYEHVQKHGRLPETLESVEEEVDSVDLYKEISNLRKSLGKDRKKAPTAKVVQRIADKERKLALLLKRYDDERLS